MAENTPSPAQDATDHEALAVEARNVLALADERHAKPSTDTTTTDVEKKVHKQVARDTHQSAALVPHIAVLGNLERHGTVNAVPLVVETLEVQQQHDCRNLVRPIDKMCNVIVNEREVQRALPY
jgi:hypothetical protein